MSAAHVIDQGWQLGSSNAADGLGLWSLLASSLATLLAVAISLLFSLGLHTTIIVSLLRCIVQLTALAYILAPAYALNRWWLTFVYFIVMLLVSSIETVSRPSSAQEGILSRTVVTIGVSSTLVMVYTILLVLWPAPWYDAKTVLPVVGLLLGNLVSGVSIGLSTAMEELTSGRDKVELLLSVGASRREALKGVLQRSVAAALLPSLQQMSILGLVAVPDFMNGQLAAGTTPLQAARLQIVVVLLGFVATALAAVAAVFAELLWATDAQHRLRAERLLPREGKETGVAQWIHAQTVRGWNVARKRGNRTATRLRVSLGQRGFRHRGRAPAWLLQSPLAQRVFLRSRGEAYDEVGSLDSRLRGVVHGLSDDEQESSFSGVVSEADATGQPENDNRRLLLASPRQSETN